MITDPKDTTFANTHVDNGAVAADARPSDSIALALRTRVPIFVVDAVFQKSAREPDVKTPPEKSPEEKAEELRRYLEELNPEDFGKWNPEEL